MLEKTMIYITGYVCHWYYRKKQCIYFTETFI